MATSGGRHKGLPGARGASLLAALALLVTASCGDDDSDQEAGEATLPAPTDWPTLGLDLANSRAMLDESTVGPDNVADLAPVWELEDVLGYSGTPIVDEGVLYGGDWSGNVWALDPETGDTHWTQEIDSTGIRTAVALDDQRVFVGTFGAQFAALDRESGDIMWEIRLDEHPFASAFSAPVYVDDARPDGGLVIVAVGSYENMVATADEATFRGSVVALDPETGEEHWRYWTTTGDDEEGAGVGVWSTPAVDLERGVLYFGTGQHHAEPTSGRSDAVIALDVATGEEQWVSQFREGDTWTAADGGQDLDVSTPPTLFEVDGTEAVGAGDKSGTYKALDRETGEELWSVELTEGGPQGGVMHSAAVVEGDLFVASNQEGTIAHLFSLDADTGSEHWSVELDGSMMGPVTWANGVVYTADNSATISGFDAEDGTLLWSYEVDAQAASGITVVDGTVYAGYGWWLVSAAEDAKGGLVAFRLEGAAGGNDEADETAEEADETATIFQQRCASCHGGDGSGATGPDLTDLGDRLSPEEQTEIIRNGRGDMPSWGTALSEAEIEALVDYLHNELGD